MLITAEVLHAVMPRANTIKWLLPLRDAADEFEINTPLRVAAFLSQLAHESGELRYVKELWGPTIAQVRYEGRKDLGNTEPGDGRRFMGRGPIKLSGRANYRRASLALLGDQTFLIHPEFVEQPDVGARVAAWFWKGKGLNELADIPDFREITRRVNGGFNGRASRELYFSLARSALGAPEAQA